MLTITCPADANLTADEDCMVDTSVDALGTAVIEATDNCDGNLEPQLTIVDGLVKLRAKAHTASRVRSPSLLPTIAATRR